MQTPPPPGRPGILAESARYSVIMKLALIGAVIVALQVPLLMIRGTLGERRAFRDEAVAEITSSWGGSQTLVGPFLAVPYSVRTRVASQTLVGDRMVKSEEMREVAGTAWFLPDELAVDGHLEPAERYRGIFKTPVYAAKLAVSGSFHPDVVTLGLENATLDWTRAAVVLRVSDARGLREAPAWRVGERAIAFRPAAAREGWPALIEAPLGITDANGAGGPFAFELNLQGAPRLAIAPVGAVNRIELSSSWPDPSFDGALLPIWHDVTPEGFSARWESAYFGRGFPQQWLEHAARRGVDPQSLEQASVGVTLSDPIDAYRLVERALKYGALFIVVIFAVFFLFEISTGVRVHPFQYLLVGAALTLFYLGYLALGEFMHSGFAYALAAGASTGLVSGYAWSVLKTGWRTIAVGAGLACTYGCLYVILQLQEIALLAGTVVLFILLGAIMWFTRRINWYALGPSPGATT